jgi:hypothetical protein
LSCLFRNLDSETSQQARHLRHLSLLPCLDIQNFLRELLLQHIASSHRIEKTADSEAVLSTARDKIRAFQNVLSDSEAEKEADDADRDEDSDPDDADDDIDGDDVNTLVGDKDPRVVAVGAQAGVPTTLTVGGIKTESDSVGNVSNTPTGFTKSAKAAPLNTTCTSNVSPWGLI